MIKKIMFIVYMLLIVNISYSSETLQIENVPLGFEYKYFENSIFYNVDNSIYEMFLPTGDIEEIYKGKEGNLIFSFDINAKQIVFTEGTHLWGSKILLFSRIDKSFIDITEILAPNTEFDFAFINDIFFNRENRLLISHKEQNTGSSILEFININTGEKELVLKSLEIDVIDYNPNFGVLKLYSKENGSENTFFYDLQNSAKYLADRWSTEVILNKEHYVKITDDEFHLRLFSEKGVIDSIKIVPKETGWIYFNHEADQTFICIYNDGEMRIYNSEDIF